MLKNAEKLKRLCRQMKNISFSPNFDLLMWIFFDHGKVSLDWQLGMKTSSSWNNDASLVRLSGGVGEGGGGVVGSIDGPHVDF